MTRRYSQRRRARLTEPPALFPDGHQLPLPSLVNVEGHHGERWMNANQTDAVLRGAPIQARQPRDPWPSQWDLLTAHPDDRRWVDHAATA